MKKMLSMVLCVLMLMSLVPVQAFAEENIVVEDSEIVETSDEIQETAVGAMEEVAAPMEPVVTESVVEIEPITEEVAEQEDAISNQASMEKVTQTRYYSEGGTYNVNSGEAIRIEVQLPVPALGTNEYLTGSRIKAVERADGMNISGSYSVAQEQAMAYGYTIVNATFSSPGTYYICVDAEMEQRWWQGGQLVKTTYYKPHVYLALIVSDVPVSSINVSPSTVKMEVGEESKLTATITPANATHRGITFYSSNSAVANVDSNGRIVALSPGTVLIYAQSTYYSNMFAICVVTVTEHVHEYRQEVTAPTCVAEGFTTYACACGNTYVANRIAATGHKWNAGVVVVQPTEESEGELICTCSGCGETKSEKIPQLEHAHVYSKTVTPPTCTEQGYTTYSCACGHSYVDDETEGTGHQWDQGVVSKEATENSEGEVEFTCSVCGGTKTEILPKLEHIHTYSEVVTPPTCTEQGYTTYSCSCGDDYTGAYVQPLNHSFTKYISNQDATCSRYGTKTANCDRCGEKQTITDYESRLPHQKGEWYIVENPTCTERGLKRKDCANCASYSTETIPAKGHTEVTVIGKAATCTENGLSDGKKCSVCGTVTLKQGIVKAKGHTAVKDAAVEATCGKEGKTEGTHCSVCNTVIIAHKTIAATGNHTYSDDRDAVCNICGHTRDIYDRPTVHMFRMYDPNSGEHFYTGSVEERDNLVAEGWNYEGVGFTFPLTTGDPVHRLYDPATGEHLYTMSDSEKSNLMSQGWNYEGVAFNSGFEDEVPQYRLHNPNETRGAYHFTASIEERDDLLSLGWEYQGIGWYSCWK